MTAITVQTLKQLDWQWRGHNIRYTEAGQGKPLFLIHGFGACIGHWQKNIFHLAEAGYHVYAMDLLGFGASAKPPLKYSLDLWQAQIKDFWHEKINRPTVFIGNSIGALLSLMLVTNHPEISAGAVLINCAGGLNHRPNELNLLLRVVMGTFTKLVSSPLTGKFIFDGVRQKNRIRNTLYQVYRDRNAVTDELVEMLYQPSCDVGAQQVFASVLTAPSGLSPNELLPNLQHPLLILWGEDDPWTPIKGAKIYQDLAANNGNVEFYSIPSAGHCPHDEKPEIVNRQIINWLANHN